MQCNIDLRFLDSKLHGSGLFFFCSCCESCGCSSERFKFVSLSFSIRLQMFFSSEGGCLWSAAFNHRTDGTMCLSAIRGHVCCQTLAKRSSTWRSENLTPATCNYRHMGVKDPDLLLQRTVKRTWREQTRRRKKLLAADTSKFVIATSDARRDDEKNYYRLCCISSQARRQINAKARSNLQYA